MCRLAFCRFSRTTKRSLSCSRQCRILLLLLPGRTTKKVHIVPAPRAVLVLVTATESIPFPRQLRPPSAPPRDHQQRFEPERMRMALGAMEEASSWGPQQVFVCRWRRCFWSAAAGGDRRGFRARDHQAPPRSSCLIFHTPVVSYLLVVCYARAVSRNWRLSG
jgi:hypothetical protein